MKKKKNPKSNDFIQKIRKYVALIRPEILDEKVPITAKK